MVFKKRTRSVEHAFITSHKHISDVISMNHENAHSREVSVLEKRLGKRLTRVISCSYCMRALSLSVEWRKFVEKGKLKSTKYVNNM